MSQNKGRENGKRKKEGKRKKSADFDFCKAIKLKAKNENQLQPPLAPTSSSPDNLLIESKPL